MFKIELKDSMRFKDIALVIYEDNKIQIDNFFKNKSSINKDTTIKENQNTFQLNHRQTESTVCIVL